MSAPESDTPEKNRIGLRDVAAGLFLLAAGIAIAIAALDLNLGKPVRMGSGFLPLGIGVLLCVVGVALLLGGLLHGGAGLPAFPTLRPLAALTFGFAAFAVLIGPGGLVLAGFAGIFLASFGTQQKSVVETAIFAVVLSAVAAVLFVVLLDLPLRLWPTL